MPEFLNSFSDAFWGPIFLLSPTFTPPQLAFPSPWRFKIALLATQLRVGMSAKAKRQKTREAITWKLGAGELERKEVDGEICNLDFG